MASLTNYFTHRKSQIARKVKTIHHQSGATDDTFTLKPTGKNHEAQSQRTPVVLKRQIIHDDHALDKKGENG